VPAEERGQAVAGLPDRRARDLPAEQPAKAAEPTAAPPPPPAAAAPPPAAPPASISSAPPPPAQTAKKPVKKPATASVTPAAVFVGKACARYIFMHCRGVPPGGGREVACLTNYVNSGQFVGPRCRGALDVRGLLR